MVLLDSSFANQLCDSDEVGLKKGMPLASSTTHFKPRARAARVLLNLRATAFLKVYFPTSLYDVKRHRSQYTPLNLIYVLKPRAPWLVKVILELPLELGILFSAWRSCMYVAQPLNVR